MKVLISGTNLNQVMENIYSFFKHEVEEKGIQLFYEHGLPTNEAIVHTDQNKINAILINLIKNAIKFTEKGSVKYGYTKKNTSLMFFVNDTGIGIDNEQKEIIIERFNRVSTKLILNYSGEGLGLSISKAYVELLGGKIGVESELGKGSAFYFTIPYIPRKIEQINNNVQNNFLKKTVGSNQDLKILIVEDDEVSGRLILELLKNFVQEIISVKSGIEAVDACRIYMDIDLIIMDIRMPGMNGYEAIRQIRNFNKKVIIVAQTAMALYGEREKAINAGCNDFISKPFTKNVFEILIKKHFKKV